jgi:hypothetical protein
MKRGIFLNLAALFILGMLVTAPLWIMGGAMLAANAIGCETNAVNTGGSPPCDTLLAILMVTGYGAIAYVPLALGISMLYLLGILGYFIYSLVRARRSAAPVSPVALGMLFSTLAVAALGGCLVGGILAVNWYRVDFVSACERPSGALSVPGVQNGDFLVSARQPGAQPGTGMPVIFTLPYQGGDPLVLTQLGSAAAWSPDGQRIAFAGKRLSAGDGWALFGMAPTGPGEPDLLLESSLPVNDPAWRPDGGALIFNGTPETSPGAAQEIFALDLQSGGLQQLTNDESFDGDGRYSPDGSQIVFVSERDSNTDIYLMDANGQNVRRLTRHAGRDIDPSWSPDGKWIVFATTRNSIGKTRQDYDLYTMSPDGSNQCRLTEDEGVEWAPVWSPDGRWIAYIRLDSQDIHLLDLESGLRSTMLVKLELESLLELDWTAQR